MAAWTQADADAVRAAIVELATGKRKVSFSLGLGGGSQRTVSYAIAQLPELEALLARIERSLTSAAPSYWLAITRTGL